MEIYENLSLENIDGEIWKEIEGYNGDYFISNLGRIKSFKGINERILKQNEDSDVYLYVKLCKNGKPKHKRIHILMFESFIEKIPEGCVVHHIDFTKNNILENFQMMTREEHNRLHHTGMKRSEETKKLISENHADVKGEKGSNSILKEKDVIEIRILLDERILTQKEIGEIYNVSQITISLIKNNKRWKHI